MIRREVSMTGRWHKPLVICIISLTFTRLVIATVVRTRPDQQKNPCWTDGRTRDEVSLHVWPNKQCLMSFTIVLNSSDLIKNLWIRSSKYRCRMTEHRKTMGIYAQVKDRSSWSLISLHLVPMTPNTEKMKKSKSPGVAQQGKGVTD